MKKPKHEDGFTAATVREQNGITEISNYYDVAAADRPTGWCRKPVPDIRKPTGFVSATFVIFSDGRATQSGNWLRTVRPTLLMPAAKELKGEAYTVENVLKSVRMNAETHKKDYTDIKLVKVGAKPERHTYSIFNSAHDQWSLPTRACRLRQNLLPRYEDVSGQHQMARAQLAEREAVFISFNAPVVGDSHRMMTFRCAHGAELTARVYDVANGYGYNGCPQCKVINDAARPGNPNALGIASAVLKRGLIDPDFRSHDTPASLMLVEMLDKAGDRFYKLGVTTDKRYKSAIRMFMTSSMTEYEAYAIEQRVFDHLDSLDIGHSIAKELMPITGGHTESWRCPVTTGLVFMLLANNPDYLFAPLPDGIAAKTIEQFGDIAWLVDFVNSRSEAWDDRDCG